MAKKHQDHILALRAAYTNQAQVFLTGPSGSNPPYRTMPGMNLAQGFTPHVDVETFADWLEEAAGHLIIGRRAELENDLQFRQILPYTVIVQVNDADEDAPVKIASYQRTSKSGEERLFNNHSIGYGGHPGLLDVIFDEKGVINFEHTFANAMMRELIEEVEFTDENGHVRSIAEDSIRFHVTPAGFIRDDSDAVGQLHLAVVTIVAVPHNWTLRCLEEDNITGPSETAASHLAKGLKFENWSQILLEHFAQVGKIIQAAPSVVARPTTYKIQPGDTLSEIAILQGVSMANLLAFNPQIKDPNLIYAGDTLNLVDPAEVAKQINNLAPGGVALPAAEQAPTLDDLQKAVSLDLDAYRTEISEQPTNTTIQGLSGGTEVQSGDGTRLDNRPGDMFDASIS